MSHYEERLEADVAALTRLVVEQGEQVHGALGEAVRAFLARDRAAAAETILGDHAVNRRAREIDRRCHAFVARHLPSAGHLRFVSAVMRMNIALERVGDYAVTISRETAQLREAVPAGIAEDIELMAGHGRRVLAQALEAFRERNAGLARGTIGLAGQRAQTFHKVFRDLLAEGERGTRGTEDLFGLLVVLYRLERVSDQAKNLCEETVFVATGQTKPPKVYSVLFVDERNDRWSRLAEALARKAFPDGATWQSAGWEPAETVDPQVAAFLDARGLRTSSSRPRRLDARHDALATHHVIVGLQGDLWSRLPEVPFHTVLLAWDVVAPDAATDEATLEAVGQRLAARLGRLVVALRGEGAG